MVKVNLADILHIESLKDYVKVYLSNQPKPILSLISLKALEEKLPADRFMRIHRSYIVPLDQIKALTKSSVQVGDITIHVSDQYKDGFSEFVHRWV